MRKKNGGIGLPYFRIYYHTIVIKTVWNCQNKNRNIAQWNRIESLERNPLTYGQSVTNEARIYNGEDRLFNKSCWENWTVTCTRKKLEHFLTPYTNTNSKWTKGLNVRMGTIKLLEENIGRTFFGIKSCNIFWICLLEQ